MIVNHIRKTRSQTGKKGNNRFYSIVIVMVMGATMDSPARAEDVLESWQSCS